ncbi:MAG: tetratricopeptide repeat protein [Bacteroidota bacterium]
MQNSLFANSDSLFIALQNAENDSSKLQALWNLSKHFNNVYPEKALKYGNQSLEISKKNKNDNWIAQSFNIIGIAYDLKGDYNKALENYFESLRINEKLGNSTEVAKNLNNIGVVYDLQNNYKYALEYYNKSLELKKKLNDIRGITYTYINISNIYVAENKLDTAEYYLRKALNIAEKRNDKISISRIYNNIGRLFALRENYIVAKDYFIKSYSLKEEINDRFGMISSLQNIGNCYSKSGYHQNAMEYLLRVIILANKVGSKNDLMVVFKDVSDLYKEMGESDKSYEYYTKYLCYKDSVFDEKMRDQISEIRVRYETDKKEEKIEILNKEKKIKELRLEKEKIKESNQQIFIWSISSGAGLFFISLFMLLFMFVQKKKLNRKLSFQKEEIIQQKEEIEAQKEEIERQRDEIEIQRDNAIIQRDNIAEQKEKIDTAINYAANLQQALLRSDDAIKDILPKSFIYFRPKDIISGDFYWFEKNDRKIYIVAADCTGHGVPGAFISMLGITFLNEIITKSENISAADILNQLRDFIIFSLHQSSHFTNSDNRVILKDGIDMTICIINKENKIMEFAGANNPLYIVRNKDIIEIKGDKMPVGVYYSKKFSPFTNHEIGIFPDDKFYLFSDGYADQFGGESGKKFKYKNFKDLVIQISNDDFNNQKKLVHQKFENWILDEEIGQKYQQVDDVLIVGFKIY